jgi:hypothetical protein
MKARSLIHINSINRGMHTPRMSTKKTNKGYASINQEKYRNPQMRNIRIRIHNQGGANMRDKTHEETDHDQLTNIIGDCHTNIMSQLMVYEGSGFGGISGWTL